MPRDPRVPLFDIRRMAEEALEHAGGCTAASLQEEVLIRRTLERELCIIGEAMTRIRDHHPEVFARFPDGAGIIGMRNHLSHRYEKVDLDQLALSVALDLPALLDVVETIINDLA